MSTLTILFVGPVRRPGSERTLKVDSVGLQSVADLLRSLGYSAGEQANLSVLLDGRRASRDTSLEGIQQVEILVLVGGG
jgi:sulfur carrier protein ThiS